VRTFDASVGSFGGCPFCPRASDNVATEDLVALLEELNFTTGIDLERLLDAAELATRFCSRPYEGHLLRARRPERSPATRHRFLWRPEIDDRRVGPPQIWREAN
jgi:hypothetical protein